MLHGQVVSNIDWSALANPTPTIIPLQYHEIGHKDVKAYNLHTKVSKRSWIPNYQLH